MNPVRAFLCVFLLFGLMVGFLFWWAAGLAQAPQASCPQPIIEKTTQDP
jgi:hypothetical protein